MKLRFNKNKMFFKIVYCIVLFLVVFNPPIVYRISFTMIFIGISVVMCVIERKEVRSIINESHTKKWIKSLIIFFAFYTFMLPLYCLTHIDKTFLIFENFVSTFGTMLFLFIVCIILIIPLCKNKLEITELFQCMVYVGVTQSIIGIMSYISPSIKSFFDSMMLANSRSSNTQRLIRYAEFRNYGFASALYDNFGFAMVIISILALALAMYGKSKINYLFFTMIAFAAFINARSSLVLVIVGAMVLLLWNKGSIKAKDIIRIVVIGILCVVLVVVLISYITNNTSDTNNHLASGVSEIEGMLRGEKTGYFSVLFNQFIFFPDDMTIILGNGLLPNDLIGEGSDVGYIQFIWKYGIVGLLLIVVYFAYPIFRIVKSKSIMISSIAMSLGVMIMIYTIKLNCFGYGQAAVVLTTLELACIYNMSDSKMREMVIEDGCRNYTLGERLKEI